LTTYTFYAILQLVSHQLPGRDIQALSQAIRGCIPDGSGERLNGIQEVSGSIPLISTRKQSSEQTAVFLFPEKPGEPLTSCHPICQRQTPTGLVPVGGSIPLIPPAERCSR